MARNRKDVSYWLSEEGLFLLESWARTGLKDEEIINNMKSVMGDSLSNETFYKWKRTYPEFLEAIKRGRHLSLPQVENALFVSAMSGNVTAQIFYLKNRDREHWKDKLDVDSNVEANVNQKSKIDNLSDQLFGEEEDN